MKIRSDRLLSHVRLFTTPGITARQASLSITNSQSSLRLTSINQRCHPAISSSVVPFSSCPQSLPTSVFSNKSTLHMRWPKYWSFSFSIIPSKEIPESPSEWTGWISLQSILKEISPGCSLEGMMAKAETPVLWPPHAKS